MAGKAQPWREAGWQESGPAMAMIVHDATRWGPEEHRALREYLAAHDLLDDAPETIPEAALAAMAERLAEPAAPMAEKQRILVVLGHHKSRRACELLGRYVEQPEPELERFARLALEEAVQWIAPGLEIRRNEPCPCGSGRKFKKCCGGGLS